MSIGQGLLFETITMPQLFVEAAYNYYLEHIFKPVDRKRQVYRDFGFELGGVVHPRDWELCGAVLLGERRRVGNKGSDLMTCEVKSALFENAFEYQYHKFTGKQKLDEDKTVNHLFVSYTGDYLNACFRFLRAEKFAARIEADGWEEKFAGNYNGERQRCRCSIPYTFVKDRAHEVMRIRNTQLTRF